MLLQCIMSSYMCSMNIYREYLILTVTNSFVVMFMLFIMLKHELNCHDLTCYFVCNNLYFHY